MQSKGPIRQKMILSKDILDCLAKLALHESEHDKMYHHWGKNTYVYLRDIVFKDVQKFNQALRIIDLSKPTGVTAQQQVNMAVSIHPGKTNHRNYNYKNFNANEWHFYCIWVHVKVLSKFAYEQTSTGSNENDTETIDNPQNILDVDCYENFGPTPSSGREGNADMSSTSSWVITADVAVQHLQSCGGGFGTKKTKAASHEVEESHQKMQWLKQLTNGINQLVHVNQLSLKMQQIKAALKEFRNDPDICRELCKQLLFTSCTDISVPISPMIGCNPLAASDNDKVYSEENSDKIESAMQSFKLIIFTKVV